MRSPYYRYRKKVLVFICVTMLLIIAAIIIVMSI